MSTPRASNLAYNPNVNSNENRQAIEDYYHVTTLNENVNHLKLTHLF